MVCYSKIPNVSQLVAFVADGEIYCVSVAAGASGKPPSPLTHGGRENGVTNGLADFIAQEEMDRYRGFWWSPDSKSIAFTEV
jgi:dipeptidyl-peptidase 4